MDSAMTYGYARKLQNLCEQLQQPGQQRRSIQGVLRRCVVQRGIPVWCNNESSQNIKDGFQITIGHSKPSKLINGHNNMDQLDIYPLVVSIFITSNGCFVQSAGRTKANSEADWMSTNSVFYQNWSFVWGKPALEFATCTISTQPHTAERGTLKLPEASTHTGARTHVKLRNKEFLACEIDTDNSNKWSSEKKLGTGRHANAVAVVLRAKPLILCVGHLPIEIYGHHKSRNY